MDNPQTQVLVQQLDISLKVYETFLEWRHKVMLRLFVGAGAAIVATKYIFEQTGRGKPGSVPLFRAGPLLLAAGLCIMAIALDFANQKIMQICFVRGRDAENALLGLVAGSSGSTAGIAGGIFGGLASRSEGLASRQKAIPKPGFSYRFILLCAYSGMTTMFLAGALWAFRYTP